MIKVLMLPQLEDFGDEESGIKRVVENYYKYLPQFDIQLVDRNSSYDIVASHAGAFETPEVVHTHGLYWTSDYNAGSWEWSVNNDVISAVRQAKQVTVPSQWVAETFQRDMRFTPHVVPHGIDWQDFLHAEPNSGYVLWNKNRNQDICSPHWVGLLAASSPNTHFISTYPATNTPMQNITVTGILKHEQMKLLVQRAGVYLSTTKETFGIGVLEALASGVPVLGFRFGGNVDLVEHGVTGYLANPNDVDDLKTGLDYCVKHRNILSMNARLSAQKWSWLSSVEKVAGIYRLANTVEPPTVSVIIPTYNYADKVERAIESAVNQTYPIDQIIVVDDGSTDNTRAVVDAISRKHIKDVKIVYQYQNNAGVANARNTGIAQTTSKYVCCLDADDAIRPEFLRTCVEALEKDRSLGIAYTGLWVIKSDGYQGYSPWPDRFNYDAQLHGNNQVPTCCVFRREIWRRLGGYNQRYAPDGAGAEDAEFWLRAGACGFKAEKVTNEALFEYSWMSGRVSGNPEYHEVDWLHLHPWTKDEQHPFASLATPKKFSHPVRQYDEPLVSVIIPVGKGHQKEVINALDSLESQTFRKWEVVLVNDTGDAELELEAYPYVRVVRTDAWLQSRGAGFARNLGVEHARAPFLLFLDADDWLYPQAIEKMMSEWAITNQIVYTDYVGKAIIGDERALVQMTERVLDYDKKTGEAVIAHRSLDFDCEKAVSQPNEDMYIWSLITALLPKSWHNEIGGFDEDMESWEDWDYWIRMAKAGKCFSRIAEQLVVYRFHTGNRRERGLHEAQHLIQYLLEKYKEIPIMGCGCSHSSAHTDTQLIMQTFNPGVNGAGLTQDMTDENIVLITYTHPNRGMHRVIGAATGTDYGYRGGGDRFLVDRRDITAQPKLFTEITTAMEAPKMPSIPTPPPQPVAPLPETNVAVVVKPEEQATPSLPVVSNYDDLQKVPGINSTSAAHLNALGVHDLEGLAALDIDELMKIRGIGLARAKTILEYARKVLDEREDQE